MKKVILVFILAFACIYVIAQERTQQSNPNQENSQTTVVITLNFPDTIPLVVQITIFDNNPFQYYDELVFKNKEIINKRLSLAENEAAARGSITSMMTLYWDQIFANVSGFDMQTISSRKDDQLIFSSDGLEGKFWVTTKVNFFSNYFVVWCLPIELEKGNTYTVEMNSDNTLDLQGLFKYVLNKPQDQGTSQN